MAMRNVLVALIVLATIGFVVGTTIERGSGETHHEGVLSVALGILSLAVYGIVATLQPAHYRRTGINATPARLPTPPLSASLRYQCALVCRGPT